MIPLIALVLAEIAKGKMQEEKDVKANLTKRMQMMASERPQLGDVTDPYVKGLEAGGAAMALGGGGTEKPTNFNPVDVTQGDKLKISNDNVSEIPMDQPVVTQGPKFAKPMRAEDYVSQDDIQSRILMSLIQGRKNNGL